MCMNSGLAVPFLTFDPPVAGTFSIRDDKICVRLFGTEDYIDLVYFDCTTSLMMQLDMCLELVSGLCTRLCSE